MSLTNSPEFAASEIRQYESMRSYYKFHAKIYNLTRWTFLFGRNRILQLITHKSPTPTFALEIGCGTGRNLRKLGNMIPGIKLAGLDVSQDMIEKSKEMLEKAGMKADLRGVPYEKGKQLFKESPDLILFSYSLTMINPQWEDLLDQALADLKPGGRIAVTDFHDSRFGWFRRHMGKNHVRMEGHLLPALEKRFTPISAEVKNAYGGVWRYLIWIGEKTT